MSNSSNLPNPLQNPAYANLINSPDPDAKNIINDFTNIYTNYVLFNSISSNVTDTSGLDNYATQIQNSLSSIINILTPCATNPSSNRCKLPVCTWSTFIEKLMVDFSIILSSMTAPGNTKLQYDFLAFNAITSISQLVTSTPSNKDPFNATKPTYYLCSDIKYYPTSSDPKLQAQYNSLKNRMLIQQKNKDTRQFDSMVTQFLLYILLPTVIFIILILVYLKFTKKTQVETPVTSEQELILTDGKTTTELPVPVKTGGAFYDTLSFITTLSAKLFRV